MYETSLLVSGIQVLRNAVASVGFLGKKRYEAVRFNVIGVTRGWVGVKFSGKMRYITLEWPLTTTTMITNESSMVCRMSSWQGS